MPFPLIPLVLAAGSAISGALANKKQTTTTAPTMAPEYSPIQTALISSIMQRLQNPTGLPQGYENAAIRNINNTYGLAGQNLANRLTARGMGSSPVAANAMTTLGMARAGQIGTMQAGLPLLERQLQTEDMNQAQGMLALGRGQQTTTPSNMLAGGFQSAADMLAYLYGKGAFSTGKKTTPASPTIRPSMWQIP